MQQDNVKKYEPLFLAVDFYKYTCFSVLLFSVVIVFLKNFISFMI